VTILTDQCWRIVGIIIIIVGIHDPSDLGNCVIVWLVLSGVCV